MNRVIAVGVTLPCGCVTGFRYCEVAVRLWAEASRAYEHAKLLGKWDIYTDARRRYDEHFGYGEGIAP